jgi:hypothetical protein
MVTTSAVIPVRHFVTMRLLPLACASGHELGHLDWRDSQLHIHHAFHSYSGGIPAVLVHEFVQLAVKSSNK